MDYNNFVQNVQNLDFIDSRETADAAVKAVLGVLASRMTEEQARMLTQKLPYPLNLEKLRGHQKHVLGISPDQYIGVIRTQFNLSEDQTRVLIDTVLRSTKETLGEETFAELQEHIPSEWAAAMLRA
ncbi:MAG: DUF2267 domain-containing protein [Candidatus Latescibacterota bacterium]